MLTTLSTLFKAQTAPVKEQATLNVRVDKELRDAFNLLCAKNCISTSEVIRSFMLQAVTEAIAAKASETITEG